MASVLIFMGIEVICFIVAHVVLCFGFVSKTVLISHQCLSVAEQRSYSIEVVSVSQTAL